MTINHPYDPRYNAKIYVPQLTEEQRRARVTPLENLRGLRFRTETPVTLSPTEAALPTSLPIPVAPATPPQPKAAVVSPTQIAPTASSPTEATTPDPLPVKNSPEPRYVPTAREVVFAEFPERYPERCGHTHGKTQVHERCIASAASMEVDPEGARPRRTQTHGSRARRFERRGQECPHSMFPLLL